MNDADDKIKKIPVRFKKPPEQDGPMLMVVERSDACDHKWFWTGMQLCGVQYLIREGETEVECGNCHTRLDPMFVLRRLATEENQWTRNRERYIEEMTRLRDREQTKCRHCGKMTPISRAKARPTA